MHELASRVALRSRDLSIFSHYANVLKLVSLLLNVNRRLLMLLVVFINHIISYLAKLNDILERVDTKYKFVVEKGYLWKRSHQHVNVHFIFF